MNLHERLRTVVEGMPDRGAVTLPVETVRGWLEEDGDDGSGRASRARGEIADLTVPEIADALDQAPSTVRGWMPQVEGAYKLGGAWRVSRRDWRAYLDGLADDGDDGPAEVRSRRTAELDDWREGRGVA